MTSRAYYGIALPFKKPNEIMFKELMEKIYGLQDMPLPKRYSDDSLNHDGSKWIVMEPLIGIDDNVSLTMMHYRKKYYFLGISETCYKRWRCQIMNLKTPHVNLSTRTIIKEILKKLGFIGVYDNELEWHIMTTA